MKIGVSIFLLFFVLNIVDAQTTKQEVLQYISDVYLNNQEKGSDDTINVENTDFCFVKLNTYQTADSMFNINSPDSSIEVIIELITDNLIYSVVKNDTSVIEPSIINLELTSGDLTTGIICNMETKRNQDSILTLPYGEKREVESLYNETKLSCQNSRGEEFNIYFRAYNSGVAFRVELLGNDTSVTSIVSEISQFNLSDTYSAYIESRNESGYTKVSTANNFSSLIPLSMVGTSSSICINEADNNGYSRVRLNCNGGNTFQTSFIGSSSTYSLPFLLPWRYILMGDEPEDLINNKDIIYSLNEASFNEDEWDWIKPGKVFRNMVLTTEGSLNAIDFCEEMNIEYMMFDAGWYGLGYGYSLESNPDSNPLEVIDDIDMVTVSNYAHEKGVGIILYVNKVAWYNYDNNQMFDLYRSWGVKGLKLGFVDGYSAYGIQYVNKLIDQAAENKMVVNVHDNFRPTGQIFKHPNLLTSEGVRGNEYTTNTGDHTTLLPFTRMLTGSTDYTVCYLGNDPDYNIPKHLYTTRGHQLALSVLVYSPLQHILWYGNPFIYQIPVETELFKEIPTVWDDFHLAALDLGNYVSMARKKGDVWYLATIGNNTSKDVNIPLDFLDKNSEYNVTIYSDKDSATIEKVELSLDQLKESGVISDEGLAISLNASGGQVCIFRPHSEVTGIREERREKKQLKIYPNPTNSGVVYINLNTPIKGISKIEVVTLNGQKVFSKLLQDISGNTLIDLSSLTNGVYILTVKSENSIYYQKLFVNK